MPASTSTSPKKNPVLYVAFTFGLILLGFAVRGVIQEIHFINASTRTQGMVTALVERNTGSRGRTAYYPKFSFSTQSGQTVEVLSRQGKSPSSFSTGDRVTVLYIPSHPTSAKIDSFSQLWVDETILTFIGLVFAGLPVFVWTRTSQQISSF